MELSPKAKKRIADQNRAISEWRDDQLTQPPVGISLQDKKIRRIIYEIVGGRQSSPNPLEAIRLECEKHPELEAIRQQVIKIMRSETSNDLAALCIELNRLKTELPEELGKIVHKYQLLGAARIRRAKRRQIDANGHDDEIEISQLTALQRRIFEAVTVAIEEITSGGSTPPEALFEMLATINANVQIAVERLKPDERAEVARMMSKAFHSIREAISGAGVLEENAISVWGSARSHPCYDRIVEEVTYRAAQRGQSSKTGGGPGSMGHALKGTFRYIDEALEQGKDPGVEAIGLPGNFRKLEEAPSPYMTMRVDHYDLDIRKLLLRYSKLILVMPGRMGTDQEMYDVLVELLTDYSNIAEDPKAIMPNMVIVGDYQRELLLRHIVDEANKHTNKHANGINGQPLPLFYFVPVDHAKLKAEEAMPNQMDGQETQRLIQLLDELASFLEEPTHKHLADFPKKGVLIDSIALKTYYQMNPVIDKATLIDLLLGKNVELPPHFENIRDRVRELLGKK